MSMKKPYNVLDLFSGAGGLSQGFEFYNQIDKNIYDIVAGLDSEKTALKTFYRNHSSANGVFSEPIDLRDVSGSEIIERLPVRNIDIILGGPPCQGFSHAGDRDPEDDRNELVYRFHEIVNELQPSFFVMENVPGIMNRQKPKEGPFIKQLQSRFNESGYQFFVFQLNAMNYGVPQKRRRIFLVGNNSGIYLHEPTPTHGKQKDLTMSRGPVVTVDEAIMDLPSPIRQEPQDYNADPQSSYQRLMREHASKVYNHTPADHKQKTIEKMEEQEPGEGLYDWNHSWIRLELNNPSPTVKANNRAPAVHPTENRIITPRECARLQSFPDDFVFEGTKSSQLEQIGNAVPPLLARSLASVVAENIESIPKSAQQADS